MWSSNEHGGGSQIVVIGVVSGNVGLIVLVDSL